MRLRGDRAVANKHKNKCLNDSYLGGFVSGVVTFDNLLIKRPAITPCKLAGTGRMSAYLLCMVLEDI